MKKIMFLMVVLVLLVGCSAMQKKVTFPASDDIFVTTGDGNIQKPYTPIGQLFYWDQGFRIPAPILGLIPFKDVDADVALKQAIYKEVRRMGGDGIINMSISWEPSSPGILGFMADGGSVAVYGTVIKR